MRKDGGLIYDDVGHESNIIMERFYKKSDMDIIVEKLYEHNKSLEIIYAGKSQEEVHYIFNNISLHWRWKNIADEKTSINSKNN